MKPTLRGKPKGALDEKRLSLPGVRLRYSCPKCGKIETRDFRENYLNYPKLNARFKLTLWCPECDHEWPVWMRLNVSLEIVK